MKPKMALDRNPVFERFPQMTFKQPWRVAICAVLLFCPAATAASGADDSFPTVELQAVLSRDTIAQNEKLTLFLFLVNKSRVPLTWNNVGILPNEFHEQSGQNGLPTAVGPYETAHRSIDLTATSAPFGPQKIIVSTDYIWTLGKQESVSTQTIALPVTITRKFEEEAKGFPGGTAAFFYLLLPVIPAILSYQFLEGLRKGEAFKLPEFKAEHVVPAFLSAIVISFLLLVARNTDTPINYAAPWVFVTVLLASALLGATIPGGRWVYAAIQWHRWGYKKNDAPEVYLRKALLSPYNPEGHVWIIGKNAESKWAGFLLAQPNGNTVLGPQVSVTPADAVKTAFREEKLIDAKLLVSFLKKPNVTVKVAEAIQQNDQAITTGQSIVNEFNTQFTAINNRDTSKELVIATS